MNIMSVYYLYSYSYSYYYQNMFATSSLVPTTMPSPIPVPSVLTTFTSASTSTPTPTPTPKSGFIPTISPTSTYKYDDDYKPVNNITNNPTNSPTLISTTTIPIIYNSNTTNTTNKTKTNNDQTSFAVRTIPCLFVSLLWISLIIFI